MDSTNNNQQSALNSHLDEIESAFTKQLPLAVESLELLLKLLNNIGSNPTEAKFRKIRAANAAIKEKVFRLPSAQDLLVTIGFSKTADLIEDIYELNDENLVTALNSIGPLRNRVALIIAKQTSPEEYARVLNIQQRQAEMQRKIEEEKQKEKQFQAQLDYDKQERKYIEVKDSIAVNMNEKRQQQLLQPIQTISGEAEFTSKVLNNELPVLVDFYADWCPPCKKLAAVIEQEIAETKGWVVAKVNSDDPNNAGIKAKHGVSGIPAVFFYYKGKQLTEYNFTGFNPGALKKAIDKAISLNKK